MEMIIPQTAAPAPAASSGNGSTQVKGASMAGSSDKFEKTLSSQIKQDKGHSEKSGAAAASAAKTGALSNTQSASAQDNVTQQASVVDPTSTGEAAAAISGAATETIVLTDAAADLMEMIDQLLADLEQIKSDLGDASDGNSDQDAQPLASMLDQLQALLALLGIPLPVQQAPSTKFVMQDAPADHNANQQLATIVSKVQDSLLQLQTAMQEGTMKQVGLQEPVQLIGQQLQALQQVVQSQKDKISRVEQPAAPANPAPEITVTTTAPTVSVHLQRLSQQAVHPAAMAAQSNQQVPQEETEASAQTEEQPPTATAVQSFQDTIRQAGQHAARLAPAVQASVPVNDFADNMKDFIQKLDIKHGNGMSEATIQLFPEELGQVDVRITMHNGQLTALFHADNASAKDALDNQMAQLRSALQQQGLSVDKLEVTYGQSAAQLSNGQHGQGTGQQTFSNTNKSKGDGPQEDFDSDVAEQQAIQDLGYGRAVNATA